MRAHRMAVFGCTALLALGAVACGGSDDDDGGGGENTPAAGGGNADTYVLGTTDKVVALDPVGAYDLGLLLGRAPVEPRWLVLVAAEAGVGLLFEHFDGYHRIPLRPDGSRQLVEMSTLIEAITGLTHRRSQNQELES